ncbi:MAG: hypothetical protein ACON3Z_18475 [Bradymonadia bacterium]
MSISMRRVVAVLAWFTLAVGCLADPPPFTNETSADSRVADNDAQISGTIDGDVRQDFGSEPNMDVGVTPDFDSATPTDATVSIDSHNQRDQMVRPVQDASPENDAHVDSGPQPPRYDEVHFAATYDSFSASNRGTVGEQLERGVRSFEFSFFPYGDSGNGMDGRWPIGMPNEDGIPGAGVDIGNGGDRNLLANPSNNLLRNWLGLIELWSQDNPQHAPITIFLRPHVNLAEVDSAAHGNLSGLNQTIVDIFGSGEADSLYRRADKANRPWPAIGDLRGKVITVLSAGEDALDYVQQVGARVRNGNGDEHQQGHPTIALEPGPNDRRRVLLVFEDSDETLVYWVGLYNEAQGRVSWRVSGRLAEGHRPAVMFLNNQYAVLVYDRADKIYTMTADFTARANQLQPSWSAEDEVHGGHSPRLNRVPNDVAQRIRCIWRHNNHYDDDLFSLQNNGPDRRGHEMTDDLNDEDNTVSGPLQASVAADGAIQVQVEGRAPVRVRYPAVMFIDAERRLFGEESRAIDDVLSLADFVTANAPEVDEGDFGEPFRFAERAQPNVVKRLRRVREENNVVPAQAQHIATDEVTSDWFDAYMTRLEAMDWLPAN